VADVQLDGAGSPARLTWTGHLEDEDLVRRRFFQEAAGLEPAVPSRVGLGDEDLHPAAGVPDAADAPVVPQIPRASTNFTCSVIGAWAADLLTHARG
jgi:hypothetical protein